MQTDKQSHIRRTIALARMPKNFKVVLATLGICGKHYFSASFSEKNENLMGEISRKELIKMLSESLSQINFFNIPNSARSIGSTEKYVNREKFEFSKEKSFVQPKITVKAIIVMVQLTAPITISFHQIATKI